MHEAYLTIIRRIQSTITWRTLRVGIRGSVFYDSSATSCRASMRRAAASLLRSMGSRGTSTIRMPRLPAGTRTLPLSDLVFRLVTQGNSAYYCQDITPPPDGQSLTVTHQERVSTSTLFRAVRFAVNRALERLYDLFNFTIAILSNISATPCRYSSGGSVGPTCSLACS